MDSMGLPVVQSPHLQAEAAVRKYFARSGHSQNMLNHGANHPKYGWKMEKFGSLTANQHSTIARLFRPTYSTHANKNANLQKIGSTSKNETRIYSHLGLDQKLKKTISVYTGRRLGEPMWVSSCRNGKLRAVAQMAQVFGSALRWEKIRVGRWKLDSKTGRCRNVGSYLQPSKEILFGSMPKHTWPGKLESNIVADHFKWSEEMHLIRIRWGRNRVHH